MIWFKHFTGYRNDPKVRALREEFKSDGYALPIMMVEIVAESLGPTNPVPFLTYSKQVWAEFVGMDVRKFSKIIARMQDIDLFEVRVEPDGKITFGSDKILEYCDKYTQDLKRTGKIPAKKYGKKSEQMSEQGSDTRSSVRSRIEVEEKRSRSTATPPTSTVGAVESSSQIEDPKARAEAMKVIKDAMKKITPQPRVSKSHDSGNGKIPKAEGQEADEMTGALLGLAIPGLDVDPVVDAWAAFKKGTHDSYALASVLDNQGIKGQDRSRIYSKLGVL